MEAGRGRTPAQGDALIGRIRRRALWSLAALAVGTAAVSRDPAAVTGVVLSGGLMVVNFHLLTRLVDRALARSPRMPGAAHMALLLGRLVLLALLLCGIVLLPGIGPIPVALGLSVLVLATLPEALAQLLPGRRP